MTQTPENPKSTQTTREPSLPQAGGWPFLLTAFLGRMPSSMVQLGYLMVLARDGRGLAVAGLAVAAVGLGSAFGGPVVGRLVDRHGPLRVVAGATTISLLTQAGFLFLLLSQAPSAALLGCAAVVGAANPQVGPIARSRWSVLAARHRAPGLVSRALGYEGAADETGFVVGPVVAGSLVTWLGASTATVTIMVLTLLMQGLFIAHLAAHREDWRALPEAHRDRPVGAVAVPSFTVSMLWPMFGCLGVGTLFGATQTSLTALFDHRGTPGLTGLVYGAVGIGSGVASLLVGRLSPRITTPVRLLGGGALMTGGALAMMRLPQAPVAAVVAIVLGLGAGVTLVSSFTWMERIAPRERMATMMTVLATCITLGVSLGAAVAGRLASTLVHGFWPVLGAGVLALVAATGMRFGR
ncbi:MFS transporter [Luteococcus sp.]|uniref:MFS transporter n=1 Tax=Luteococcus sp. TaxID=1969402 RepID=UPI0037361C08